MKDFSVGASLGGIVAFSFLSTAIYMNHTAIADVGIIQPAVAIAIALLCGLLNARFKGNFLDSFVKAMNTLGT
ncbi:MAG: hypothetical protein WBA76_08585 [Phormidesmis sp.]